MNQPYLYLNQGCHRTQLSGNFLQFQEGFQIINLIETQQYLSYIYKRMNKLGDESIYSIKCGVASCISTYIAGVLHPLQVIKTRFQSHDGKSSDNLVPKYKGTFNALKVIYVQQGLQGLYKGFYISLFCQATSTAIFFSLYEMRKKAYEKNQCEEMEAVTWAGLEAALVSTFITQPLWVIKTRMLLETSPQIKGSRNFLQKTKEIYRQSGYRGFLKGMSLSIMLSAGAVLNIYFYQWWKMMYSMMNIPHSSYSEENFICGSLGKLISVLIMHPLTTMRTRIQQNQYFNNRERAKYERVSELPRKMLAQEGIQGFYKGLGTSIMKVVPQKGMYFFLYEYLKKFIKENP